MDPSAIGPSITALSTGLGTFGAFLPRLTDVRKTDAVLDDDGVRDVRHGEIMSVAVTVGVGVILSSLTKSNVPTYVALVVALGLVAVYESSLRSPVAHNTEDQ